MSQNARSRLVSGIAFSRCEIEATPPGPGVPSLKQRTTSVLLGKVFPKQLVADGGHRVSLGEAKSGEKPAV